MGISLASSTLLEFHLHQEEFPRSRSPLTSTPMESSTCLHVTSQQESRTRSPSPMTRDVFPRRKLRGWSMMLRNSRTRTTSRRIGSPQRTVLRAIASIDVLLSSYKLFIFEPQPETLYIFQIQPK